MFKFRGPNNSDINLLKKKVNKNNIKNSSKDRSIGVFFRLNKVFSISLFIVMVFSLFQLVTINVANIDSNAEVAEDITSGLVGHWKFNQTSGSTVTDSAGTNNMTIQGGPPAAFWSTNVPYSDGGNTRAGYFNSGGGIDEYGQTGNVSSSVIGGNARTVCAWGNPDGQSTIELFALGESDDTVAPFNDESGFALRAQSGTWNFIGGSNFSGPTSLQPNTGVPVDSGWQHLCLSYSGSAGASEVKLFKNGEEVWVYPISQNLNTEAGPLLVGKRDLDFTGGFARYVDDLRLYNRVLTENEVQRIANALPYPGGVSQDLALWLRADEGGEDWTDQSPNGATVTKSGTPSVNTTGLNFNSTIDLDGTGDWYETDVNINADTQGDVAVSSVYIPDSTNAGSPWGEDNSGFDRFIIDEITAGTGTGCGMAVSDGIECIDNVPDLFNVGQPSLSTVVYDEDTVGGSFVYVDGDNELTFTSNAGGGNGSDTFHVGQVGSDQQAFDGQIAETIVYNQLLDGVQSREKIESYLGIKYGITLDSSANDYLNSNGDSVYNFGADPSWVAQSVAGDDEDWSGITYADNQFVAVSEFGTDKIMTSIDGTTWTVQTSPAGDDAWTDVTYGDGQFVAVGLGFTNRIVTSPDGVNWTPQTGPANNDWRAVTYGNGVFVAVADNGPDRIATSTDGVTWTARSATTASDQLTDVVYANNQFVAVGYNGNRVITSPDGITWTAQSAAGNDDDWASITYANGLYVVVGDFGVDKVMTSPDGVNWTVRSAAGDNDTWYAVTYGNGQFVAVGEGPDTVMTSTDGINWTAQSAAGDDDGWLDITFAQDKFVAVGLPNTDDVLMTLDTGNTYNYRVAGIAYDKDSALDQRISKSQEGDSILTITTDDASSDFTGANGGSRAQLTDGQFLVLGSNGGLESSQTSTISGYSNQVSRQWRAENTGGVGNVNVKFDTTAISNSNWDLIQSDFSDFENASANLTKVADLDSNGEALDVSFVDGKFYGLLEEEVIVSIEYETGTFDTQYPVYQGASEDLSVPINPEDMSFNNDGTKFFVNERPGVTAFIREYVLGTPYDISTAVYQGDLERLDVTGTDTSNRWFTFGDSGTKVYVTGSTNKIVYQYNLGMPYDVSTGSYAGAGQDFSMPGTGGGIRFNDDGTKFFAFDGGAPGLVHEHTLTIPWDLNSASIVDTFTYGGNGTVRGFTFANEGNEFFIVDNDYNVVRYVMSTPYDVSTAVLESSTYVEDNGVSSTILFNPSGSRMFLGGLIQDDIGEYELGNYIENNTNDGSVGNPNPITMTLTNDTFADGDGDDLLDAVGFGGDGEITINNVPSGLTPVVTLSNSDTVATLTFSGNATDNDDVDDVEELTIEFADSAFVNSNASDVINSGESSPFNPVVGVDFIDTPGLDVNNAGGIVITEGGVDGTFNVVLETQPAGNVVINVTSGDTGAATVGTAALTFTTSNWNVGQSVAITAVDDPDKNDESVTITFAVDDASSSDEYDLLADENRTVNITDNDTIGICVWDGDHASNDNWSEPTNWDGDVIPDRNCDVLFSGDTGTYGAGADDNAVIDTGVIINSLTIEAGYSGDIDGDTDDQNVYIYTTTTMDGTGTVSLGDGSWTFGGDADMVDQTIDASFGEVIFGAGVTGPAGSLNNVTFQRSGGVLDDWTTNGAAGNNDTWRGVVFAEGLFVAVSQSSGDSIMTSTDGVNWTARTAPSINATGIAYGNGVFVSAGLAGGGNVVIRSEDGITWTSHPAAGNDDQWSRIIFADGRFVAVAITNGNHNFMTSTDGITWTATTGNDWLNDIAYGDNKYVAVGAGFGGGVNRVMTSPDGTTWTAGTIAGDDEDWQEIEYGNGTFVAISTNTPDRVATSPDGINWTVQSQQFASNVFAFTYGNGVFVAISDGPGANVYTSYDGVTWEETSNVAGGAEDWRAVTFGNGQFVAVGQTGQRSMVASGSAAPSDINLNSNLDINGDTKISANSVVFAGSNSINFAGDFDNAAGSSGFIPEGSGITFDSASNQNIFGATNWYNFAIGNTGSRTVGFEEDLVQNINGEFAADIASGNEVSIRSIDSSGVTLGDDSQHTINIVTSVDGSYGDVTYLDIRDSILQEDGATKSPALEPANSTDGGNNLGWFAPTYEISGIVYHDEDGEGDLDAGETARLEAIGISLYDDNTGANSGNGAFDGDETQVGSSVDSAATTGAYSFNSVPAGDYLVVVDIADTNLNNDSTNGSVSTFGVTTGQVIPLKISTADVSDQDFGFDNATLELTNATPTSVSEEGGVATWTLTQSVATGFTTDIARFPTGSAAFVTDYTISGDVRIFPGNTTSTFTTTGVSDNLVEGSESITITLGLNVPPNNVELGTTIAQTITLLDDEVADITVSPTAITVAENLDTETFTVVLDSQPISDVVIDLTSGSTDDATVSPSSLTFTNSNWNTPQTVTVTAVEDDIDRDDSTAITVSINDAASHDAFDSVADETVNVTITDNDTAGVDVDNAAGISITEDGANGAYDVVLETEPTSDVVIDVTSSDTGAATVGSSSITFTTANWDTPQSVAISPVSDDDLVDETVTITFSVNDVSSDDAFDSLADITRTVSVADSDSAGFNITTTSVNITEGLNGGYNASLDAQPSSDVEINFVSNDTSSVTVTTPTLTFTPANWNTPQDVFYSAIEDADLENEIVTITASINDANSDDSFDGLADQTTTVNVTDNDTATIIVNPDSITVNENAGSDTFTVALGAQPASDVVIDLASSAIVEGTVTPTTLTFTTANWNTPQTVTITGVDDDIDRDDSVNITVTVNDSSSDDNFDGLNDTVAVTLTDDDTVGFTVTKNVTTDLNEPSTVAGVFSVVLDSEPTSNVEIDINSNDTSALTVVPTSLTFTPSNWDTAQNVGATAVDDPDAVSESGIEVTFAVDDANSDDTFDALVDNVQTVNVVDNDTAGVDVNNSTGINITEDGANGAYDVVLESQPASDVVIDITSSDTGAATVGSSSLTFTPANWNTPQSIAISPVTDDDLVDETVTITFAVNDSSSDDAFDGISIDRTVSVADSDSAGFTLTPFISAGSVNEGDSNIDQFAVTLDAQPASDVVLDITSSNSNSLTTDQTSLTFTSSNWSTQQNVSVSAPEEDNVVDEMDIDITISVNDAGSDDNWDSLSDETFDVDVVDNDTATIVVNPNSITVNENAGSDIFTVVLGAEPSSDVVIDLTSSDIGEGTVSPATLTFTSSNWDTPQTVTITGVDDGIDRDDSVNINVVVNDSSSDDDFDGLNDTVSVTLTDDDTVGLTVTPEGNPITEGNTFASSYSVVLDSQPTSDVQIDISSDNSAVSVDTITLTFTNSNWDTAQDVSITAVEDANLINENVTINFAVNDSASDDDFDGLSTSDNFDVVDNDVPGFSITPTEITIDEEVIDTFQVALTGEPSSDVVLNITSADDTKLIVSDSSLTFNLANWSTPQTVSVTSLLDTDLDDELIIVTVSVDDTSSDDNFDSLADQTVTVNINDGLIETTQSVANAVTGENIDLIVTSSCGQVDELIAATEQDQGDDPDADYPLGLISYEIPCDTASVEILWYGLDLDKNYALKKVDGAGNYSDFDGVFEIKNVNGQDVLSTKFDLVDGGVGDATGVDGVIVDPIGLIEIQDETISENTMELIRTGGDAIKKITLPIASVFIGFLLLAISIKKHRNRNSIYR